MLVPASKDRRRCRRRRRRCLTPHVEAARRLRDLPDRARAAQKLPGYGYIDTRAPGGRVITETCCATRESSCSRWSRPRRAESPSGAFGDRPPARVELPVLRLRLPAQRDASGHVLLGLLAEDRDLLRRRA